MEIAAKKEQEVARSLVPLIQAEIEAGDQAGIEHYRRAGEMLIEAKEQVAHGEWQEWLKRNFNRSLRQAQQYMQFAIFLFYEHLQDHLVEESNQWCSMACFASTFFGRNSENNREAGRQRLNTAFCYLLDRGVFIVIDYHVVGHGHHGEAKAAKILKLNGGESSAEKQLAEEQIKRMFQRKQLTEAQYNKASDFLVESPTILVGNKFILC